MALVLHACRHGRQLLRALASAESCLRSEVLGRPTKEDGAETSSDKCSTSDQLQTCFAGVWPRSTHIRKYAINNKPSIRYVPVAEPEVDDFSTEPTTFTQLLAALRNAKNIGRLQHLMSKHIERFDVVHVAAAVARLPSLIEYRNVDLVDRSNTVVVPTPGLPTKRFKHGAKPRQSHLKEGARIAAQLDAHLERHAQGFQPRQAACSIWAFGELRRRGVVERMNSLPDVLLAVTKGNLEPLRVHGHGVDYAQLLQGLAKLGHNDPSLMESLLPLLQERLGSMQQQELQMTAYGLASLGYGRPEIFNAIADELLRTGTAFLLPSGAAAVFWSFAKVKIQRPDLFAALANSMLGQAVLLAPNDIVTTLWAASELGYQNPQLFTALAEGMRRSLATCSDAEVSSALASLAALGYHHAPLMDAVAASILAEPVIGANPVHIVRVMYAYTKLGRRSPQDTELVSKLAKAMVPKLFFVRADTLVRACIALQRAGFRDEGVLSAVAARAEVLILDFDDMQLAAILRLLGSSCLPHFQLAVASARHLHSELVQGGKHRRVHTVVESLYWCARQAVEDAEAAEAVLALAAAHPEDIKPVDAARLVVIGQVMNKQSQQLVKLADVVLQNVPSLDADTAAAVLRSVQALGRNDLAAALTSHLQQSLGLGTRQARPLAAAVASA